MLSTRQVILSQDEVCEAVRAFVRTKYHEKIEKGYRLTSIQISEDGQIVNFLYEETLNPFVKSPKVKHVD
jgi:hypothetical protein